MNGTRIKLSDGDKLECYYGTRNVEVSVCDSQIRVRVNGVTVYPDTELLNFLRSKAVAADISSKEWDSLGASGQAAFRSGLAYGLECVEHRVRGGD